MSFLGLGVPLHIPTWGNILNVAQDLRILQNNWWVWLPVGIMISLFVLSVNFIGDGLRDSTIRHSKGSRESAIKPGLFEKPGFYNHA